MSEALFTSRFANWDSTTLVPPNTSYTLTWQPSGATSWNTGAIPTSFSPHGYISRLQGGGRFAAVPFPQPGEHIVEVFIDGVALAGLGCSFDPDTAFSCDFGSFPSSSVADIIPWRFPASGISVSGRLTNNSPADAFGEDVQVFVYFWDDVVEPNFPPWPPPTIIPTVASYASGQLKDTATLSGFSSPTGTLTFELYTPSGILAQTSVVTVTGNGVYESTPFTPTVGGTWRYKLTYSGDDWNPRIASPFGQANEDILVPLYPGLSRYNASSGTQEFFIPSLS